MRRGKDYRLSISVPQSYLLVLGCRGRECAGACDFLCVCVCAHTEQCGSVFSTSHEASYCALHHLDLSEGTGSLFHGWTEDSKGNQQHHRGLSQASRNSCHDDSHHVNSYVHGGQSSRKGKTRSMDTFHVPLTAGSTCGVRCGYSFVYLTLCHRVAHVTGVG